MNYRSIKKVMKDKNYAFFTKPLSINIVGVRTNVSNNTFNDTIYVLYIAKNGRETIKAYQCTTKPGRHWLLTPLNSSGTAIIAEGQYRGAYKIGVHNRSKPSKSYKALEQKSNMTYYRDNNKDDKSDFKGNLFTGNFKTNIHRAGESGWSKFVDKWSAGCQVITGQNVLDGTTNWLSFLGICEKSSEIYGNSFTYTLLNENDFNV
jgi:hypothetical protein